MKKYSVYCTFFGKKVKYNVFAKSENEAIGAARANVVIDKVTCDVPSREKTEKDTLDFLGKKMGVDFSDIFKGK
jgi:hypothetical protein